KPSTDKIERLDKKLSAQESKTNKIERDLTILKDSVKSKVNIPAFEPKIGGTGFLIDGKGLMITNAHVVKNSRNIFVQNNKGEQFKAFVVRLDIPRDVAIIKIDDDSFKVFSSLPYGISKTSSD